MTSTAALLAAPINESLPYLSVRANNCLRGSKVMTLIDLIGRTEEELLDIPNFGRTTLAEIKKHLAMLGLHLGETPTSVVPDAKCTLIDLQIPAALKERLREIGIITLDQLSNMPLKQIIGSSSKSLKSVIEEALARLAIEPSLINPNQTRRVYLKARIKKVKKLRLQDPKIQRLQMVHGLYIQEGTLEKVATKLKMTRERVRQLLTKGSQMDLFRYDPRHKPGYQYPRKKPPIDLDKMLNDYKRLGSVKKVASENGLSFTRVAQALRQNGITEESLISLRREKQRNTCLVQYRELIDNLGHDPTSTELTQTRGGRALYTRIRKYWKSLNSVRKMLNIPVPPPGNPKLREMGRLFIERRMSILNARRMDQQNMIRQVFKDGQPLKLREIAAQCDLKLVRTGKLLSTMLRSGEIQRQGQGKYTQYVLAPGR